MGSDVPLPPQVPAQGSEPRLQDRVGEGGTIRLLQGALSQASWSKLWGQVREPFLNKRMSTPSRKTSVLLSRRVMMTLVGDQRTSDLSRTLDPFLTQNSPGRAHKTVHPDREGRHESAVAPLLA